MDDFIYLSVKLFLKNQQWMWQHSSSNIFHLYMFIVIWLLKEIWISELFLFEIDVEEKKKAQEKKEKKGVQELLFLSFSLPNTNSSFFPCSLTF